MKIENKYPGLNKLNKFEYQLMNIDNMDDSQKGFMNYLLEEKANFSNFKTIKETIYDDSDDLIIVFSDGTILRVDNTKSFDDNIDKEIGDSFDVGSNVFIEEKTNTLFFLESAYKTYYKIWFYKRVIYPF